MAINGKPCANSLDCELYELV
ncbi:hypothetical protein FQU96_37020 [Reyranella sp. CPCC 100927]|nr:hypothetical protein FQU96_37020 [Reyranella sp. CPCC 100927]